MARAEQKEPSVWGKIAKTALTWGAIAIGIMALSCVLPVLLGSMTLVEAAGALAPYAIVSFSFAAIAGAGWRGIEEGLLHVSRKSTEKAEEKARENAAQQQVDRSPERQHERDYSDLYDRMGIKQSGNLAEQVKNSRSPGVGERMA